MDHAEEIKLISLNMGMGIKSRGEHLVQNSVDAFAEQEKRLLAEASDATVIAMQEVDFDKSRSGYQNYAKRLSDYLNNNTSGNKWNYFYYDPSYFETSYGIAVVSNVEITKEQHWRISDNWFGEKRAAIALKIKHGEKFLWLVNTHLTYKSEDQKEQIQELMDQIKTFDERVPVLLCGDFNIYDYYEAHNEVSSEEALLKHYNQTIGRLVDMGFKKFSPEQSHAPSDAEGELSNYTFHSWKGSKWGVIDYIMGLNSRKPSKYAIKNFDQLKTRRLFFYDSIEQKYESDHHGLILQL